MEGGAVPAEFVEIELPQAPNRDTFHVVMAIKISEAQKETLRRAAEEAVVVCKQIDDEIAQLKVRLARWEAIIEEHEETLGRRPKLTDTNGNGLKRPRKTHRGQIARYVDLVLATSGPLTEAEIIQRIKGQH